MTEKKFYITTPIYYPSDYLHIGHCYCTIAADTMARYKRITGYDVYFLTGTDEHGEKIERKAEAVKSTPKAYVDNIVKATKELWKRLNIDYTHYIRTTDDYHVRRVQKIFQILYDKNFIYKGLYKGLYCVSDEAFFTDSQVIKKENGKCYCPDCEKELEYKEEECYYLKLSDYGDWLINYYKEHPEFLGPKERMNEMLNNFLLPGLEDLAVTRKGLKWGIECPIDKEHSIYVWIDALSNYITALGYPEEDDLFKKYWACDVHFVGKEIVRFHSIIWPIMLKMLDIPLPKKVFGHGWILFDDGKKMSKSRGNVVEPNSLIDKYGVDALRYFLMREINFGIDGYYSQELLLKRINSDLANDYGNLWHRITTMLEKYFNGILPEEVESVYGDRERELKKAVLTLDANVESALDDFKFNEALSCIWEVIRMTNKYVEESAPWNLAKDKSKKDYLANVMYISFQSYYIITAYLQIFFVETPKKVFNRLGLSDNVPLEDAKKWGSLNSGIKIERGEALFKRYNIEEEIGIKPEELKEENKKEINSTKWAKDDKHKPDIEKEEFEKLELLTAKIIFAEKVENADKLIKFVVDIGEGEQRVVVSSIAEYYKAEEMIGKTVLYLANLKPKKFRGILSHGMLLLADNGETLSVMQAEKDFKEGCKVN